MAKKQAAKAPAIAPGSAPIVRANINREVLQASEFVSLYTNDTQVQLTPWDIRFIFGQVSEPATLERPTTIVKTVGEVRMSLQHAKAVALILLQQLQQYETSIGPIHLPKD